MIGSAFGHHVDESVIRLVALEVAHRNSQNPANPIKLRHDALIAGGAILEIDGHLTRSHQPVVVVGMSTLYPEDSAFYHSKHQLLSPHLRQRLAPLPQFAALPAEQDSSAHVAMATLSKWGGQPWRQELVIADQRRIVLVDGKPVNAANILGCEVVGLEPLDPKKSQFSELYRLWVGAPLPPARAGREGATVPGYGLAA
jgi:hypothetical protein